MDLKIVALKAALRDCADCGSIFRVAESALAGINASKDYTPQERKYIKQAAIKAIRDELHSLEQRNDTVQWLKIVQLKPYAPNIRHHNTSTELGVTAIAY